MVASENMPDLEKNPKAVHPVGIDIPKWGGKPEKHGSNVRTTDADKKRKATERENGERRVQK